MENKLKTIELFAGAGGFRLGLEGWQGRSASSGYRKPWQSPFEVVWSNQWEPSTKAQHASAVYENRFGTAGHTCRDIETVEVSDIPDHDLLVGGFPCQDYSVATTLKNSKGLLGKKGVLWWAIHRILSEKERPPRFLFLENVDRLLLSPAGQRGRDFAIILKSLDELGYAVEWRVVNAAEYGMPQRRRRVFILGFHRSAGLFSKMKRAAAAGWLLEKGVMASAFPVRPAAGPISEFELPADLVELSQNFNQTGVKSPFENSGLMVDGRVSTAKLLPDFAGRPTLLGDVLQNGEVGPEFFISEAELPAWQYLKGPKKAVKTNAAGFEYNYSEGGMAFPDPLDRPSRTIITGEGGRSPSRFKHVIFTKKGHRRLSPVELERLNMFPDDHTRLAGVTDSKRAFLMGNALVVGAVEAVGRALAEKIEETKTLTTSIKRTA